MHLAGDQRPLKDSVNLTETQKGKQESNKQPKNLPKNPIETPVESPILLAVKFPYNYTRV
jgi:hypothetical protein